MGGGQGVAHDSGEVGVVCGPGPEASRTQKRQKAKEGQKDTPRFWFCKRLRFWVVSIREGGEIGFKKRRVKQENRTMCIYARVLLHSGNISKRRVECACVASLSSLASLSFLAPFLVVACSREIVLMKVTAEYELNE